jgi:hypothetical protein
MEWDDIKQMINRNSRAHVDHHIARNRRRKRCTDVVKYHMHTAYYHIILDSITHYKIENSAVY